MKIETTLVCEGHYEKGFFTNNDGLVIAKVKSPLYTDTVEQLLIMINNIYDQQRPIKDDSFDIMWASLEYIRQLIVFI